MSEAKNRLSRAICLSEFMVLVIIVDDLLFFGRFLRWSCMIVLRTVLAGVESSGKAGSRLLVTLMLRLLHSIRSASARFCFMLLVASVKSLGRVVRSYGDASLIRAVRSLIAVVVPSL